MMFFVSFSTHALSVAHFTGSWAVKYMFFNDQYHLKSGAQEDGCGYTDIRELGSASRFDTSGWK